MNPDLATYIRSAIILVVYPLILIALAVIGSGCVDQLGATDGADDIADPPPPILDECPPCVDVSTCIAADLRIEECKLLCSVLDMRCPGSSGTACVAECFDRIYGVDYCPFGGQ